MAEACANLDKGAFTTGSGTTASKTTAAGGIEFLTIFVSNASSNNDANPTVSGVTLTWGLVMVQQLSAVLQAFTFMAISAASHTGALTLTINGTSPLSDTSAYIWDEITGSTGVRPNPATAGNSGSVTGETLSLANLISGSGVYVVAGTTVNETITFSTGYTGIAAQALTGGVLGNLASGFAASGTTTPGATWASSPGFVMGIELLTATITLVTHTSSSSSGTDTAPTGYTLYDYLGVAAGGGGSGGVDYGGGGGSGGVIATLNNTCSAGATFTWSIGAIGGGTSGSSTNGGLGDDTTFQGQTTSKGGGGGANTGAPLTGGSGGGGSNGSTTGAAGTGGQGTSGGNGVAGATPHGGGGGGATAAGGTGTGTNGGNGGNGLLSVISGAALAYGGGGGGAPFAGGTVGSGGRGGGGAASYAGTGTAGTANTGGGGGGSGGTGGGNGGSGYIAVLWYQPVGTVVVPPTVFTQAMNVAAQQVVGGDGGCGVVPMGNLSDRKIILPRWGLAA